MREGRLPLAVLVTMTLASFALVVRSQPGPAHTYTLTWTHDGASTDTYTVFLDGALLLTVPNDAAHCAGTPRTCSTPLTMTTGVSHTVVVRAVNIFGDAASDPFSASPPVKPSGVVIR